MNARGSVREGSRTSPAANARYAQPSYAHITAIIATPNAASGRATGGTTGVSAGVCGQTASARTGIAVTATTLSAVTTAAIRLAAATPNRFAPTSAAMDTAATICPAEMLRDPSGRGTVVTMRAVDSEGTK